MVVKCRGVDPNTWKPTLSSQNQAGHPIIVWTKGQAAALELWVDRGDGNNFNFFTINTEPNTTDTTPPVEYGNTKPSIACMMSKSGSGAMC